MNDYKSRSDSNNIYRNLFKKKQFYRNFQFKSFQDTIICDFLKIFTFVFVFVSIYVVHT